MIRRRLVLIVNPHAARMQAEPELADVLGRAADAVITTRRSAEIDEAIGGLEPSERPPLFAVAGGDGTLSTLVDALARRGLHEAPLAPLRCGALNRVARAAGVPRMEPGALLERARRAAEDEGPEPTRVDALRVVSSLEPRARFGFELATGALYRAVEESVRRGGGWTGLLWSLARGGALGARAGEDDARYQRVYVDGALTSSAPTLSWVSALPGSPVLRARDRGVPVAGGRLFAVISEGTLGETARSFAAAWLKPGRSDVGPLRLREAGSMVFDLAEGHALDGAFYPAREPHVVQITPGPRIPIV